MNNIPTEVLGTTGLERKKYQENVKQIAIISAWRNVLSSMYYVDLEKNTLQRVLFEKSVKFTYCEEQEARKALDYLTEQYVSEEFLPKIRSFIDIDTLSERMKDGKIIFKDYLSSEGEWKRCGIMVIERNADGRVVQALYTVRSIGELKKKEQEHERILEKARRAEAESKAKTDFLFNMSHDIRTPMNAIIGFTDLLKKHIDDREMALSYIEKIETSNTYLLSIINNVLEMARIESGKESLDEGPCNIYDLDKSLYALCEPQMKKKNLEVDHYINVEHSDMFADSTKLSEILLNVASNAIKYTPSGGKITIEVSELPSEKPGFVRYQFLIEDTGIGMSKKFLPHLFDEFTRERTTTDSKVMGTGLGMPIVKKLVEMMDGTIDVVSEQGKGSRFTISIPFRMASDYSHDVADGQLAEHEYGVFAGKRILLAEDNELNAEIAMSILEDEGFEVDHAEDGVVCVDMLQKSEAGYYDLILMDVQMPNMNGYGATLAIRRLEDQQKANIPVIAMTANAFDEDKRNAFRAGMNAHVAKPLDIEVLNKTLQDVLTRPAIGKETVEAWSERLADCDEVQAFEDLYRSKDYRVGHFVYEACGDEKILYADDNLVEMFGCNSFEEFYNHVHGSFKGFVHHQDIDSVEAEIVRMVRNSDFYCDRVKYRVVLKDGTERRFDDVGHKVFTEYTTPVFYVCIADISGEQ